VLHLQIDPQSGVPIYRQVMDQVKYYVASGIMPPGAQLPSIRELSRKLAVNPTTIVKAYTELEHEHVIDMRQGKGAFITAPAPRMSEEQQRRALERLARQLAVEARQMAAPKELVVKIVEDQFERLNSPDLP